MAAFDHALSQLRNGMDDLLLPERINQLALDQDHRFRSRKLTPGDTLRLFVQQVVHGNIACSAVRHLAGEDFSDSAWCQARSRLPMELIQSVHWEVVNDARRELNITDDVGDQPHRWHGHRVYVVDGSSDSMPDTPELRDYYGVPSGCREALGFPMSHLLLLMDDRSGLLMDCIDAPMHTSDLSQTPEMHAQLQKGDVLLGDDLFGGWAHLALVLQSNLHFVGPVHHRRTVDFNPGRQAAHPNKGKSTARVGKPRSRIVKILGHDDQLVEWFKPSKKPAWMSDEQWLALPESITLRELRRAVARHGFRPIVVTIVTTLLDPNEYLADDLVELRLSRWMIETNIRHLKITLGMDVLKCKTLSGVRKERLVFLLVYNLIRLLMLREARRQTVNVNRLSFADTLAWLRLGKLSPSPSLIVNPLRTGRLEPRAIKRAKKQFSYMTQPRAVLKSQLMEKYRVTS